MSKMFKAGDKVRCLTDNANGFTKGKVYTVREYPTVFGNVGVTLDDIGSNTNGLNEKFFERLKVMKVKDIKVGMKFKSLREKDGTCSKAVFLEKGIAEVTQIDNDDCPYRLEFYTEAGDLHDYWYNSKPGMKKALQKGWLVPIEEEVIESETEEPKEELKEELKAGDIIRITEDCEVDWGYYLKGELRSVNTDSCGDVLYLVKLDNRLSYRLIRSGSLSALKYELVKIE